MNREITAPSVLLLLLLVVVMSAGGCFRNGEGPSDGSDRPPNFSWLYDLDEARELAAAEDKPLLVVFRCEP